MISEISIVCTILCGMAIARIPMEPFDQEVIAFKNYGLYFRPIRALIPTNNRWFHTYAIPIPNLPELQDTQAPSTRFCTASDRDPEAIECQALIDFKRAVYEVEMKAYEMLNSSYNDFKMAFVMEVRDIFDVRSRRAWLDIVGRGLSVAFGVATHEDLIGVYNTLKALRKSQADGFQMTTNLSQSLGSFMRLAQTNFDTIFKTFQAFNNLSETFNRASNINRRLIFQSQQLLTFVLRQSVEFTSELYYITHFKTALTAALQGRVTPELIPPSILQETIDTIKMKLTAIKTNLYLVHKTPQSIYSGGQFTLYRDRNQLYVTIAFDISPLEQPLTVYQTVITPVPLTQESPHVTVLAGIPPMIAFNRHSEHYITFDSVLDFDTQSSILALDKVQHVLRPVWGQSCLSAFFNAQLELIDKQCHFKLLPDAVTPQVISLAVGRLLLINISEYTLTCLNGSIIKMLPQSFVEVQLPCQCIFNSPYGTYYPRLIQCDQEDGQITQLHPVNRVALSRWFSSENLKNITANSGFKLKPKIPAVEMTSYQTAYTQQIRTLQQTALSLDLLTNSTQQDGLIFQSLAHRLEYDIRTENIPITATSLSLSSWQGILNLVTFIGTLLCGIGICILYKKQKALAILIAIPKVTAAPLEWSEGDLMYLKQAEIKTVVTTAMTPLIAYDIHVMDILNAILLTTFIGLWIYQWIQKNRNPLQSFAIYVEVSNVNDRLYLKMLELPIMSGLYKFFQTNRDLQLATAGYIFPNLQFNISPLQIQYTSSGWEKQLPTQMTLNWIQGHIIRKILESPNPHFVQFFLWEGGKFHLLPLQTGNELYPNLTDMINERSGPKLMVSPTVSDQHKGEITSDKST